MDLYAAAAKRLQGELVGGPAGQTMIADADRWMANEGIRSPEKMAAMRDRLNRLVAQKGTYRTRDEVTRFFHGLELVEPGMVRIQQWRPDSEIQAKSAAAMWGGVGRKP